MSKKLSILLVLIVAVIGIFIVIQLVRPRFVPDATSSTEVEPDNLDEAEALLAFAHCMQDNGVPNYPDPKDGGINLLGTGIDRNSPEFQAAQAVCEPLLPHAPGPIQGERSGEMIVPGDSPWEKVVPGGEAFYTMAVNGVRLVDWSKC